MKSSQHFSFVPILVTGTICYLTVAQTGCSSMPALLVRPAGQDLPAEVPEKVSAQLRTARDTLFDRERPPVVFNPASPPDAASNCVDEPQYGVIFPEVLAGTRLRPELPIRESEFVITGEITGAHSHLSPAKSIVYTEFTVRVNEVVKGNLQPKQTITILRRGGRIMQKSGEVIDQAASRVSLHTGTQYLLFLLFHQATEAHCAYKAFGISEGHITKLAGAPVQQSAPRKSGVEGRAVSEVLAELRVERDAPRPNLFDGVFLRRREK